MEAIKKKYIVDEKQKKVAVQIDIQEFEKIERVIEDYALGKLIEENDSSESLTFDEAKLDYQQLQKAK